jgi:hypothetical protein
MQSEAQFDSAESVAGLQGRLRQLSEALRADLSALLGALGYAESGPQRLAEALGLDKVLCSRLLRSLRHLDPLGTLHQLPGPEPLRRFARAAGRRGAPREQVTRALASVAAFEDFLRHELGDRSSLDALLSAWVPEARQEFELRRRQSAYKALSQLQGVSARCSYSLVLLHPSAEPGRIDIVWLLGLYGIQRERPGARIKLVTRRLAPGDASRQPQTLGGEAVESVEGLRLDSFCDAEPARLEVHRSEQNVRYLLADQGFGKRALHDLLLAEVNRSEMAATPAPGRRGYVFVEVAPPSKLLLFDVLVHRDLYAGLEAQLEIYDTSFEGVVDANDPARQLDRLELHQRLERLDVPPAGLNLAEMSCAELPRHAELSQHVFDRLGWAPESFRGYRCRMDYPVYGSQLVVAFGTAT